jgi:hypothetical protein
MRDMAGGGPDGAVAGLVLTDGGGRYYAIAADDLGRYRVPPIWVSALTAVVHGAERAGDEDGVDGQVMADLTPAQTAFLHEAIGAAGGFRLAVRRLEVWTVSGGGTPPAPIAAWLLLR